MLSVGGVFIFPLKAPELCSEQKRCRYGASGTLLHACCNVFIMNNQIYLDKLNDVEYQLRQILAYARATNVEAIVAQGEREFGADSRYAYATGTLSQRLTHIAVSAQRALNNL